MRWSNPLICVVAALAMFCLIVPLALPTIEGQSSMGTAARSASPAGSTASGKPAASATAQAQPSPLLAPEAKKVAPEFMVIIDPSHGGDDKGATYANRRVEKEITLAFARELRKELDDRGIAAHLLREADITLPMEKRAEIANGQRNAIYVAIHAGRAGQGVRIYSATLPALSAGPGPFVPWSTAQSGALPRSRILARAVVSELQRKKVKASGLDVPLRPLNNIVAPAIAVELAPNGDLRSQESLKTQNTIAAAVAEGIATSRAQMGVHP